MQRAPVESWHFPGAHTDLHPELVDRHNQPNHLCCLQPHLPGIGRQEVKLLGVVVKVCQASKMMSPALHVFSLLPMRSYVVGLCGIVDCANI